MSVRLADPERSRIVLVGTPAYTDPGLPDVPVVANNVTDLAAVLTDPALGGFNAAHCAVVPPDAGVAQVGEVLERAAKEAEDLLLFYYSGHGLLGPRHRELFLSLAGTRRDLPAFSAVRFDEIRNVFLGSRAASRVVILDSCFSGRAIGEPLGEEAVLAELEVSGTYTLTSAPANRTALILDGEQHTAFTGRLLDLLRTGSPQAGELLSLGDIYRHLRDRLRSEGLPEPQQRGTATADRLGLARNRLFVDPRHRPAPGAGGAGAGAAGGAGGSPRRLPEGLRAGLDSPYPGVRAAAVEETARWLDNSDPRLSRAAREALEEAAANDVPLVARTARAVLEQHVRAEVGRAEVVRAEVVPRPRDDSRRDDLQQDDPAPDDPPPHRPRGGRGVPSRRHQATAALTKAERVAEGINFGYRRAEALATIAKAVAATDPGRAERLWSDAEHTAARVDNEGMKAVALAHIARTMTATDPGRAQHLASVITDPGLKERVLLAITTALAATDPDRAERLAATITRSEIRVEALAAIAKASAATDDRLWNEALQTADRIPSAARKELALAHIASALATLDPDRAERLAATILLDDARSVALGNMAIALAPTDPDRAERLAARITPDGHREAAQAELAVRLAPTDPARAARLLVTITRDETKADALAALMKASATTDPRGTARLAATITDPRLQAEVLATIARTLTTTAPHEAEHLWTRAVETAESIADEGWRAAALANIAAILLGAT